MKESCYSEDKDDFHTCWARIFRELQVSWCSGKLCLVGCWNQGSSVVGITIAFMIYEPQSLGLSFLICHIRASERWIFVALPGSGILWVCESPSVPAIVCLASSVCHKD